MAYNMLGVSHIIWFRFYAAVNHLKIDHLDFKHTWWSVCGSTKYQERHLYSGGKVSQDLVTGKATWSPITVLYHD